MIGSRDDEALELLLSSLCDGTIEEDDLRRLGARVAAEPETRRTYLEYLELHAMLQTRGPAADIPDLAGNLPPSRRSLRRWAIAGAAAALLTLAWIALRGSDLPTAEPRVLGRLAEVSDRVEWRGAAGDWSAAQSGQVLLIGQTLRTGPDLALAVLELEDGTRLELGPDGLLYGADDATAAGLPLVLSTGLLRADVRPRPAESPLRISTPQAEIRVLGTRFLVSATRPDRTEVETETGSVRVTRFSDGRSVDVPAGSGVSATPDVEALEARPTPRFAAAPRSRVRMSGPHGLAYSPDGARLTALSGARWSSWAVGSPSSGASGDAGPEAGRALLAGDGRTVFVPRRDGRMEVFDASLGTATRAFEVGPFWRWLAAVSYDGSRVASGHSIPGPPHELRVWDVRNGAELARFVPDGTIRTLALSPDGRRVAASVGGMRPGTIAQLSVWDVDRRTRLALIMVPERPLQALVFSPDGLRLAGATDHGSVHVWDGETGTRLGGRGLDDGWSRPVRALAFSPDGRLLAAGTVDGRVRLLDSAADRETALFDCDPRSIALLAFAPDGRTIAVSAGSGSVTVWDIPAR